MLTKQLNVLGAAQRLLQGNRIEDPPRSAASFKQMLQQRYGTNCPDFLETSWQDAAAQAHRQFKFLLVYLHSADHEVMLTDVQLNLLAFGVWVEPLHAIRDHGSLWCVPFLLSLPCVLLAVKIFVSPSVAHGLQCM